MAARDTNTWETAIGIGQPDDVIIRGERLTELIGKFSFAEMMFLILNGKRATKGQVRVLDGLLISVMDHGIAPSSLVARVLASYGVPLQVGIAGGALTFGDIQGGAGQQLAKDFHEIIERVADEGPLTDDTIAQAAKDVVADSRARKAPLDGFGHPQHPDGDPRTPVLLKLAKEEGVFSHHCELLTQVEAELARTVGRSIPANIDGASAALLLDLGFTWETARVFVVTPRTVGLTAHYLEEKEQGNTWRHVPLDQVSYTGPVPEN